MFTKQRKVTKFLKLLYTNMHVNNFRYPTPLVVEVPAVSTSPMEALALQLTCPRTQSL